MGACFRSPATSGRGVGASPQTTGPLTALAAFLTLILGCNGYLPTYITECPANAAWLEIIIGAVVANVGGQAAHSLTKRL